MASTRTAPTQDLRDREPTVRKRRNRADCDHGIGERTLPDTTEQRLRKHDSRSGTTIHGGKAILFGLPFAATGAAFALIAAGLLPAARDMRQVPAWILADIGGIFGVPGLWIILHGLGGLRRAAWCRAMRRTHPTEPWRCDLHWDAEGGRDEQPRGARRYVLMLVLLGLFAAPLNCAAWTVYGQFGGGVGPVALAGLAAFFDLIILAVAAATLRRTLRWMKCGRQRLAWRRFPFFLGDNLDVDFVPSRRLRGATTFTATLRCVREEYVTVGVGEDRRSEVHSIQVYRDARTIEAPATGGSGALRISFPLPSGDYATRLTDRPPRYWELEITAALPGLDFRSVFLAPVYARPGR